MENKIKEEFEKRLDVVCGKENDYERFFAIWQVALEYREEEVKELKGMIESAVFVYEEQLKRMAAKLNDAMKIIEEVAYEYNNEAHKDLIERAHNFLQG
jgi:hypothetical protein